MNFINDLINAIGTPQITWAMIFAVLGYLGKTVVDHYAQKRKTINELQAKSGIEAQKEQEVVRVSILSQILDVKGSINWICHQFLGHAKNRAEGIISDGKYIKFIDDVPVYPIKEAVLGLGNLLAQLNNFRTYQYLSVQKQLSDVDLLKKIEALEESLSRLGVFRGHQKDLSLFVLQKEKDDFSDIIKSKKQRAKAPQFLVSSVAWAENLVQDFIVAWARLGKQTTAWKTSDSKIPDSESPTLSELGIDLSQFIRKEHRSEYEIEPDVARLQVNNESIDFVKALYELNVELQTVFTKLNKVVEKQKRG